MGVRVGKGEGEARVVKARLQRWNFVLGQSWGRLRRFRFRRLGLGLYTSTRGRRSTLEKNNDVYGN